MNAINIFSYIFLQRNTYNTDKDFIGTKKRRIKKALQKGTHGHSQHHDGKKLILRNLSFFSDLINWNLTFDEHKTNKKQGERRPEQLTVI